jgi:hypothetical protein
MIVLIYNMANTQDFDIPDVPDRFSIAGVYRIAKKFFTRFKTICIWLNQKIW